MWSLCQIVQKNFTTRVAKYLFQESGWWYVKIRKHPFTTHICLGFYYGPLLAKRDSLKCKVSLVGATSATLYSAAPLNIKELIISGACLPYFFAQQNIFRHFFD